jgi:hypothetical protein
MSMSPDPDLESADALDPIAERLEADGIGLCLTGVQGPVREMLDPAATNGARSFTMTARAADQEEGG